MPAPARSSAGRPALSSAGLDRLEWGDLRILLAICRAGSLVGAARRLDKDHSTLFRKLNRIEADAGVRFFERLPTGYAMTDAGEIALRFGERIESEFHALGHEIDGRDARLQGTVRITAPDGICTVHLPPLLAEFRHLHPDVVIELMEGSAAFDLSRREADVAIRAARKPPDDSLGRKICDFRFAAYATPAYLAAAGRRDLAEHDWVLTVGLEDWFVPAVWKQRAQLLDRAVLRTNSVTAAQRAAEAGLGVTPLPCYRGDESPTLVRASPTFGHLDMELWIVTHPVLRHTARVRVLMAFLHNALEQKAALFAGMSSATPARSDQRRRRS
jgi:DNA-binding transcriptional LysR family regulator